MDKMDNDQENLDLLIKINKGVKSQRKLSDELGYSLGKLNYCLKALKYKGLIKIKNFRNNENKLNYMYILTPKGVSKKSKLALKFMQRKMKEYDELKNEIKNTKSNKQK
jgi:EPS-associated MarR family transcriptional regulator|tara:strand:- start:218 stop:544 length:327 start_codon:yes stop_codon:yes gene_type:complete